MRTAIIMNFVLISFTGFAQNYTTKFESSGYQETVTYQEGLAYYKQLAADFKEVKIFEKGPTDSGHPLHVVMVSKEKDFDLSSIRKKGMTILMINNGIHPGESDGIDACQMMVRDLLLDKNKNAFLNNVVVAIVPFYNIGGALNRNSTSRVNQNGPVSYGFRGNARNFDLNRDFIKNDTKNSVSFARIFHELDPEVFIDTHVSNGADYPYVITIVEPQKDKLGEELGGFVDGEMMPKMFQHMMNVDVKMTPYVNAWGATPDKGWPQFFDGPRYSSGYAALFQTIGFMSETHMLKPYKNRVEATYHFLLGTTRFMNMEGNKIMKLKKAARSKVKTQKEFPISWKLDRSVSTTIEFEGYTPEMVPSALSGDQRLKYHRDQPFKKSVPYYNKYVPDVTVTKPDFYIIPQGWHRVIEKMKLNGVEMERLTEDKTMEVEAYHIEDYNSPKSPYEGHYFHSKVEVSKKTILWKFRKGDVLVPVNQINNRYIVETLEPQAYDSFFRWNYFDSILQMKEHYSSYVFEDLAVEIVKENADIREALEKKRQEDPDFAQDGRAQLDFVYKKSDHYEKAHLLYPVFRFNKK